MRRGRGLVAELMHSTVPNEPHGHSPHVYALHVQPPSHLFSTFGDLTSRASASEPEEKNAFATALQPGAFLSAYLFHPQPYSSNFFPAKTTNFHHSKSTNRHPASDQQLPRLLGPNILLQRAAKDVSTFPVKQLPLLRNGHHEHPIDPFPFHSRGNDSLEISSCADKIEESRPKTLGKPLTSSPEAAPASYPPQHTTCETCTTPGTQSKLARDPTSPSGDRKWRLELITEARYLLDHAEHGEHGEDGQDRRSTP